MKDLDYGKEYKYAHSYEGNFVNQIFYRKKSMRLNFMNPEIMQPKRKYTKSSRKSGVINIKKTDIQS